MPIMNTVIQGGGTTPTGTKSITANGVYDVTDFASADVQVPTTAPAHYIEKTTNAGGTLIGSDKIIDLTGVTGLDAYILYFAYYKNVAVSGAVNFNDLTSITGPYACYSTFEECTNITSVSFSSLTSITAYNACSSMFNGCTGIISVNLPKLTTISNSSAANNMFQNCKGIISINLPSLTNANGSSCCGSMFRGCIGLTSVGYPSLSSINGSQALSAMFYGCTNLASLYFYALTPSSFGGYTNQFNSMLSGVTGCTVHFPMSVQATISSWADVTNGFGGTNTTVLFDVVTSLTGADSNTYTRKQKESTSTATAWTYNDTLYYTSGTTEPTVGATIYSDSACTTAVTTISSIAQE